MGSRARPPLVRVTWADPCSHSGEYNPQRHRLAYWQTVGYQVDTITHLGLECIVVSSHENLPPDEPPHYEDVTVIPLALVLKIKKL